jgi:hypothetical protein
MPVWSGTDSADHAEVSRPVYRPDGRVGGLN